MALCTGLRVVTRHLRTRGFHIARAASSQDAPVLTDTFGPKSLTLESINRLVVEMRYAVRGPLVIRAEELQNELKRGANLPFKEVIMCNIGNPQSVKQPPVSFVRATMAACTSPWLANKEDPYRAMYPADVLQRADKFFANSKGTGAYSESKGIPYIRGLVAEYLKKRDGFAADPSNIFLTNGASEGVKLMLDLVLGDPKDGIMIPLPQYPLYSAAIKLKGGVQVGYYLDEAQNWKLDINELKLQLEHARNAQTRVRGLVVINPGNPTGNVLTKENIREIVEFCEAEGLVIFADEVYQENIYGDVPFTSFKKVVCEMNSPVELVSFHSTSKGMYGECGVRGGYMELHNMLPKVVEEVYKLMSVNLCANIPGQVVLETMINKPQPGDPSFGQWQEEYLAIYDGLKEKAIMLEAGLNAIDGITSNKIEGAMYAFPKIEIPDKAVAEAETKGIAPDAMYCMDLLEKTGVCVVPGAGFGQADKTYHFRTTFLPPKDQIGVMLDSLATFHREFTEKYS